MDDMRQLQSPQIRILVWTATVLLWLFAIAVAARPDGFNILSFPLMEVVIMLVILRLTAGVIHHFVHSYPHAWTFAAFMAGVVVVGTQLIGPWIFDVVIRQTI